MGRGLCYNFPMRQFALLPLALALLVSCTPEEKSAPATPPATPVPASPAAAPIEALKASAVVGEVSVRTARDTAWQALRVGRRIEGGMDLRTGLESLTELVAQDGSSFTVHELSVLSVDTLLAEAGRFRSQMGLDHGSLEFRVRKVAGITKNLTFETPTAVAAIRGTGGRIYATPAATAAYLDSGSLQLTDRRTNNSTTIAGSQAAVQDSKGFSVRRFDAGSSRKGLLDSLDLNVRRFGALRADAPAQLRALAAQGTAALAGGKSALIEKASASRNALQQQAKQTVQSAQERAAAAKASATQAVQNTQQQAAQAVQNVQGNVQQQSQALQKNAAQQTKKAANAAQNLRKLVP